MANESKAPAQATCVWAQREDYILLTIQVEGCAKPDVKLTPEKLVFNGVGKIGKTDQSYVMEIEFMHPVIPEETKKTEPLSTRFIVMKIVKKEKQYWPRITKEKLKVMWVFFRFGKHSRISRSLKFATAVDYSIHSCFAFLCSASSTNPCTAFVFICTLLLLTFVLCLNL